MQRLIAHNQGIKSNAATPMLDIDALLKEGFDLEVFNQKIIEMALLKRNGNIK